MDLLDLLKATVVCGALAYLCYTIPVVGQAMVIGLLALLWLGYAHGTILRLRRRRS